MTWKKISLDEDLTAHAENTSNPHSTTAAHVGLGNCDNTADVDKPISTATQTALDSKGDFKSDGSVAMTGNLNFDQNQGVGFVAENLSAAPSSPVPGQVYFNTTNGALYINIGD